MRIIFLLLCTLAFSQTSPEQKRKIFPIDDKDQLELSKASGELNAARAIASEKARMSAAAEREAEIADGMRQVQMNKFAAIANRIKLKYKIAENCEIAPSGDIYCTEKPAEPPKPEVKKGK